MAYMVKNIKFRKELNVPPVPQTKVVSYGCSYSGALVAWAREIYPEIFVSAVAGSAPIQAQVDFNQYFDPIMQYGSKACITAMQNMISYVDDILFGNSAKDVVALKQIFDAQNLYDDSFADLLVTNFSAIWQYGVNTTYNAFDSYIFTLFPNDTTSIDDASSEVIQRNLLSYTSFIKEFARDNYCYNPEEALTSCLSESNLTNINGRSDLITNNNASWRWQRCSELGYFQAGAPSPSIVSQKRDVNHYLKGCESLFGETFYNQTVLPPKPIVSNINSEYKGWNVNLNQTIFIDGEYDSWRFLSMNSINAPPNQNLLKKESISIIVPMASHCTNYATVTEDSPQYLDIYLEQLNALKLWLK